ncbi:MAG TPA: MBL fold metallo-hydrolase [Candidatus Sulfotelmatobacter sp.]|nr:MBL fold metallo-hydrolase [Candidatus Sulfotelmatobacter sp.]
MLKWSLFDRLTGRRRIGPPGEPAPRVEPDLARIRNPVNGPRVTWIGHASFLVQTSEGTVLVDPVFSSRIAGTIPRHGKAGLEAKDLPAIDAIAVTHNHYDHLDAASIGALPRRSPVLVPEGLGRWFRKRRFADVREMRWWDRVTVGGLRITFVPARHWSRRRPWDTNTSWWGGYVIQAEGSTIYHAGDSAAFDGFATIAQRFRSIDLAMIPIGAYQPAWFMEWFHMNPEQAGEAFLTLGAKAMVPMHWGAFRLTDEPLREPVERLRKWWATKRPTGKLHVMAVGETILLE